MQNFLLSNNLELGYINSSEHYSASSSLWTNFVTILLPLALIELKILFFHLSNRLAANAKTFIIAYEELLVDYYKIIQGVLHSVGLTLATNDSSSTIPLNTTLFEDDVAMGKVIKQWKAIDPDVIVCM